MTVGDAPTGPDTVAAPQAATTWARRVDVLWRSIPGLVVLARPEMDGGDPVTVDGSGWVIWEMLASPIAEAELVELLAEAFAEDPDQVAHHVHALLVDLEDRGFVQRVVADTAAAEKPAEDGT